MNQEDWKPIEEAPSQIGMKILGCTWGEKDSVETLTCKPMKGYENTIHWRWWNGSGYSHPTNFQLLPQVIGVKP